jgi:hypothetical protein
MFDIASSIGRDPIAEGVVIGSGQVTTGGNVTFSAGGVMGDGSFSMGSAPDMDAPLSDLLRTRRQALTA